MKKTDAEVTMLLDLSHTAADSLFDKVRYPWEVLTKIRDFIINYGRTLSKDEYDSPSENVWIHKSAEVFRSAYIGSYVIIGPDTHVRHCSFIRECALIGKNCVVGNSTELKNVILFDNVQVPHYNYVGDSILGYRAHMGAGSITSNVKSDKKTVFVHFEDCEENTGLRKFGAVIGDNVEIGCGTVLNPGSIVGRETSVYPLSSVRQAVDARSIYKRQGEIAERLSKIGS